MRIRFAIVVVALATMVALGGCGDEYHARRLVERIKAEEAEAQREVNRLREGQDRAAADLRAALRASSNARAQINFDRVAATGGAGVSESVRRAKKHMDNPAHVDDLRHAASEGDAEVERLQRAVQNHAEAVSDAESKVSGLRRERMQAESDLSKIQAGG